MLFYIGLISTEIIQLNCNKIEKVEFNADI